MSRIPQLSACPSCEEPLEPADHFCGACGFDLSSVPEPPRGRPDAVSPDGPPAEGGRGAPVAPKSAEAFLKQWKLPGKVIKKAVQIISVYPAQLEA
ncbi:hypothetical protein ACWGSE_23620, partial [Streptomyces diastaticus]